jgi:hypothetical protein
VPALGNRSADDHKGRSHCGKATRKSNSVLALRFCSRPEVCQRFNETGLPKKGASAERRILRDRSAQSERCRWAGSRRAPLLGDALAFRRSTAALANTFRRRLSPVPRFMAAPTDHSVRRPGSQLLADRRRGRPGGFPNRPNAVCETAPRHRSRSTFRIASGKRPMDERDDSQRILTWDNCQD